MGEDGVEEKRIQQHGRVIMSANANRRLAEDPAWFSALTLSERIALRRASPDAADRHRVDWGLAEERRNLWRSQPPFADDSYFTRRLEAFNLTPSEFLEALGAPVEELQRRSSQPPSWLACIDEAFGRLESERIVLPEIATQSTTRGFLILAEPLIERALEKLRDGITQLLQSGRYLPFDPENVEKLLLPNLIGPMMWLVTRTMVLELNVARLRGLLEGETPEERFQSFLTYLRQPGVAISILREYPVLARQLAVSIDHWLTFSLEFLAHLCEDWALIRVKFSPESDPGQLTNVGGGAGDTHRKGRSVVIAKFTSGFRVVYKPHSVSVDLHFSELLAWLNEHGTQPGFRTFGIIDRGSHGWTEFIATKGCDTRDELERFYERQGGFLAVLYALEATDFHYENLIASGEHPVLVDLEALFHPRVGAGPESATQMTASNAMHHSVLRAGMLPQRMWGKGESEGVDLSGLGGAPGQMSPYRVPVFEDEGTDSMRLVRKRVKMSGAKNRPSLAGTAVNTQDFAEQIIAGFTNAYRLILEHRDELLCPGGLLDRFADDTVRAVLRATKTYGLLLGESYHPDVLRDALDRDRLLDRLWIGIENRPHLPTTIPAELADLEGGDIPLFSIRPGSRDLWTSTNQTIPDFLNESSLDAVRRRIGVLSEEDLSRQSWFIRASLSTLTMGKGQSNWKGYATVEPSRRVARAELMAAARDVAERIDLLAMRGDDTVSWLGITLINERSWTLLPVTGDLYSGIPGIALFLGYFASVTGEERYAELARLAIGPLRKQIEVEIPKGPARGAIGGYTGWGGLIYALTHLSSIWSEPALIAEAEVLAGQLSESIQQDQTLDVIGGSAGCIGALMSLYRCSPSARALATAIQCGERLIERAQSHEFGTAWITSLKSTQPLTGFSHGAAGMAWALLQLAAASGEKRFERAAREAIAYERAVFDPVLQNWPDFRDMSDFQETPQNETKGRMMCAWCHGAPGVGLSRIGMMPYLDDSELISEIRTAVSSTLAKGFGINHSLCHGDLGNIDLLLEAHRLDKDLVSKTDLDRITAVIHHSIKSNGWLCGVPLAVETPGLLTGLAGIGYQLLRLAEPDRVPSVLMLAPPLKTC